MSPSNVHDLFDRGGEMGRHMRAMDWSSTRLGEPSTWPQSLLTALSICLSSRFPMLLWWGPDLCVLYNDAYIPIFAQKHPWVLGRTGREAWGEVWDVIGPMFDRVMTSGEATWSSDQLLVLTRKGFAEETYLTWSYSPILVETAGVGGVFAAVIETTERVLGERRLSTLRALSEQVAEAKDAHLACARAAATLGETAADIPFALAYLLDEDSDRAVLAGAVGVDRDSMVAPKRSGSMARIRRGRSRRRRRAVRAWSSHLKRHRRCRSRRARGPSDASGR